MRKIRVMAFILTLLMLVPLALVGCKKDKPGPGGDTPDTCNHSFYKWEKIQDRTCTTDGLRIRTCKKCGFVEEERTPAYGHDYGDYISDNNATCTEDGTKSQRCKICGHRVPVADEGSALGHKFVSYKPNEDGLTETAVCIRCEKATDTRILGIKIDFEGDRNHLCYNHMVIYTAGDESKFEYKTADNNSFLEIRRPAETVIGSSDFGVVLLPRADLLKGANTDVCPSYVVEYKLQINKAETKDLVLLSGTKRGITEVFGTYDSKNGTINSNAGPVYTLKDGDYDKWMQIAFVLNDGKKAYDMYVNGYLVVAGAAYKTVDGYYMGYDLEELDIKMVKADGQSSKFAIDDINQFIGVKPTLDKGAADQTYEVYVTKTGEKILLKKADAECVHEMTKEVIAPTCTASGYTLNTCAKCGGQTVTDETAPEKHDFQLSHKVPATCTSPELESYVCSKCGAKDVKEIGAALGHEIDYENKDSYVVTEPTCTEPGYTIGKCKRCQLEFKTDVKKPLGHEIDFDNKDSYVVTEPTCEKDGYTVGKCKRCQTEITVRPTPAKGHVCSNPEVIAPTCTEPGYEKCKCEVCGKEYTRNDVAALGHIYVSEIENGKIVTDCIRCHNARTEKDLSTKVPTSADMAKDYGKSFVANYNKVWNFETWGAGVHGSLTDSKKGNKNGFVPRFGTIEAKTDILDSGNKYGEICYGPQNKTPTDSNTHCYTDINCRGTVGKTTVFEMSFRAPADGSPMIRGSVEAFDRTKKHSSSNIARAFVYYNDAGEITLPGDPTVYGVITSEAWTRIAAVFHLAKNSYPTYDFYINGVLVARDRILMDGEPNTMMFDCITDQFRINFNGKQDYTQTAKLDIDEIYAYYADMPSYVTGMAAADKAVHFVEADRNKTVGEGDGAYSYLEPEALYDMGESKIYIHYGEHAQMAIEKVDDVNGLRIRKNKDLATVNPDLVATAEDTPVAPEVDLNTYIEMPGHQNDVNFFYESQIKFDKLSGRFDIVKANRGGTWYSLISVIDGNFVVNGNEIIDKAEMGKWHTIAVKVNHREATYTILLNGFVVRENVKFAGVDRDIKYGNADYRFYEFGVEDEFDVSTKNTNILFKNQNPKLNLGKYETVEAETLVPGKEVNIIYFTENTKLSDLLDRGNYHYPGKESFVPVDGESYLELKKSEAKAARGGVELVKIDKDGNIVASDAEGTWAMKTTNWKTNGSIPYFTRFDNVPVKDGYYDFLGYDSIRFRFFVKKTNNCRILLRLSFGDWGSKNPVGSGGYTYFQNWITLDHTGWYDIDIKFTEFPFSSYPVPLNAIKLLGFEVNGWGMSLTDGCEMYISTVSLKKSEAKESVALGNYKVDDTICKEHTLTEEVVAPTAHTPGYTKLKCSKCGYFAVKEGSVVPPVGHAEGVLDPSRTIPATCDKPGYEYYVVDCPVCGKLVYEKEIPSLGHKWVIGEKVEPSCGVTGYVSMTCANENCPYHTQEVRIITPTAPHKAKEGTEVEVKATCTTPGYKEAVCEVCGEKFRYDEVPALGHAPEGEKTRLEANCQHPAGYEYICKNCGQKIQEWDEGSEKTDHTWGDYEVVKEPTCKEQGSKKRVCSVCGEEEIVAIPNDGIEHKWGEVQVIKPTATSEGKEYKVCTVCGEEMVIRVIPAITEGMTPGVDVVPNDTESLVDKYTGTDTKVEIPGEYAGKPVVITKKAFNGNTAITSITIGSGTTISQYAFENCTALTEVIFNGDVTIPVGAFKGCTALKSVVINGKLLGVDANAFDGTAVETVKYAGEKPEFNLGSAYCPTHNDKFVAATWTK